MDGTDDMRTGEAEAHRAGVRRSPEGGLVDVLGTAAMVLDTEGRIALWSPQAERLLGYTPQEALGRFAARILVDGEHFELVLRLFAEVMSSGETWAGSFPVRCKDGTTRLLEFRNMRLQDDRGDFYALVWPRTGRRCGRWSAIWRCPCDWSTSPRSVWRSWAAICGIWRPIPRWSG